MTTVLVILLLLIFALLAIPVALTFQVSWQQDFQGEVILLWLFGLVRVRLPSPQTNASRTEDKKSAKKKKKKIGRSERSPTKKQNVFAAVRQKAFRQRIFRFVRDIWQAIQKKDLSLRVRVGLGDPADTGQLWALLGPVAGLLSNSQQASITIEPNFFDSCFDIDSSGKLRIIPLQLLYLTFALLLSPPVWRGIKQMRTVKN